MEWCRSHSLPHCLGCPVVLTQVHAQFLGSPHQIYPMEEWSHSEDLRKSHDSHRRETRHYTVFFQLLVTTVETLWANQRAEFKFFCYLIGWHACCSCKQDVAKTWKNAVVTWLDGIPILQVWENTWRYYKNRRLVNQCTSTLLLGGWGCLFPQEFLLKFRPLLMMLTKVLPRCYPAFSGLISLGMVMEYHDTADRKEGGKDHNRELTTTSKQLERRRGRGAHSSGGKTAFTNVHSYRYSKI